MKPPDRNARIVGDRAETCAKVTRMKTNVGWLSRTPVSTWAPAIRPELFAGKREACLGKSVAITQFGVNHLILEPGSASSLRHWHEGEDEFVYVISGELTLVDDDGEHRLSVGAFAGFPAGCANAHHLVNRSAATATAIVVGTRKRGEETIHYPDDELGSVKISRDLSGDRTA